MKSSANQAGPRTSLRAARFQDYQQIAELEARYGLGDMSGNSYEKWSHLWQGNPAYRELQPDWNIGWVLEDGNGQIVGSIENIPLLYELRGKRILAATARGWVAEPAYRGASLLLLDHVINQPGVDLYLNTTASTKSLEPLDFFQSKRVPVGLWDEWVGWITNYPAFLASALAMKNYPLARTLSYPLSAAFLVKDGVKRFRFAEREAQVTSCPGFDDRFDGFWIDLKTKNPDLLLAVRTRDALEWHFRHALLNHRLWIATIADGSRLEAYAIFDRKDHTQSGLKRMRLIDFQSLDGGTGLLYPIIAWALKKCESEGLHVLTHSGRYLDEKGFVDTASFRRKLPAWSFFYRANNPELAASLKTRDAWAPSLFDGDAAL